LGGLHERLSGLTPFFFCRRGGKGHGYENVVFTDRNQLDKRIQDNGFIAMGAKSAIPIATLSGAYALSGFVVRAAEEPLVFFPKAGFLTWH
jgi:hypothetical protein